MSYTWIRLQRFAEGTSSGRGKTRHCAFLFVGAYPNCIWRCGCPLSVPYLTLVAHIVLPGRVRQQALLLQFWTSLHPMVCPEMAILSRDENPDHFGSLVNTRNLFRGPRQRGASMKKAIAQLNCIDTGQRHKYKIPVTKATKETT